MEQINLNFGWKFQSDFKKEYVENGFDDSDFSTVDIPHNTKDIPYNYFDDDDYKMLCCYRKTVFIPTKYKDKSLILTFDAVGHYAEVFVNGKKVCSHKGGYTQFSIDISTFIEFNSDNLIAVMVDSHEKEDIPPFGNVVDYLCYGGIYRETYIVVLDKNHIEHARIAPYEVLTNPQIGIKLSFNEIARMDVKAILKYGEKTVESFEIPAIGKNEAEVKQPVKDVLLWDLDNPNLYTLELIYNGDKYLYSVGFREAKFTAKGFFLNGKRVGIIGLNRHQAYPYVGYAMPKSAQTADADLLKELGLNMVRTSHYPQSKHFFDRCDEIGLLVFTEIPGWQFISQNKEWREVCCQHAREMVLENYNHPSIVMWGVRINESSDDHELFLETNRIVRELDDVRQTGGVRNFPQSEFLEDVYTYNDFTHTGRKMALLPRFIMTKMKNPLLVTEHNGHMYPTKRFDHEKKLQSHTLRHAAVLNAALGRKNTCGAIGWCMSDYNTHKDFGSGDKICYHGVTDMFRIDKTAAFLYRSQQNQYPVLELTSNMEIGEIAGGRIKDVYMLTNCEKVNLYKNGTLINTFDIAKKKHKSRYKHLPNPPILLDDIIGNQIEQDSEIKVKPKDCKKLKKLLLSIQKNGAIPAVLKNPFTLLYIMMRYKLNMSSLTEMFFKYTASWGSKSIAYKFEGIKGDQRVVIEKSCCMQASLAAKADSTELKVSETYDVTRIEVRAVGQTGTLLPYSNEVVTVKTEGDIEVIGSNTFSLIGGARAFWIRTTKQGASNAKVQIESDIGNQTIEFSINK